MDKVTRRQMMGSSLAIAALCSDANAQNQPKMADFKKLSTDVAKDLGHVTLQKFETLSNGSLSAQLERLASLGVTPGSADDVNAPWGMLLNKIGSYVTGGDPKNVQLVTDPRAATWDDPKYGPYRLCKLLGDSMPKWGATFEPALGNSFGDQYGIFLGNIQLPATNADDNKKVEKARSDWQTGLDAVQKRKGTVGGRWTNFNNQQSSIPPDRRMSFDDWYQEFEAPIIGSMQNSLNLKVHTYVALLNKAGGGYALIAQKINAFSQETATVTG